jgi:ABC-type multidrug transport system ATPase subunit
MNNLELIKLNKHYGQKHALKDFSFTFTNGVYGLLGPNGAGKSTLMYLISGILNADKDGGCVKWNGEPINKLGKVYREHLGFMPQQQELYRNMTAQIFLEYISALKGIPPKNAPTEIKNVLEQVELSECTNKKIGGFSGGMKQRLLIASAILGNPDLLILDEPTAGLDPKQRVIIRKLTEKLSENKIIIISTHIVSDIETIAKEIIMMNSGQILTHGTVTELTKQVIDSEPTLENLYMQYYGGGK